ncbi:MAG: DUF115 domain-containing protein [Spirochaetales bacterium]|nr:DUF115 domain-containing protein [Spirochaetales bacterium]
MKNNDPLLIDTGRGFSILYRERYLYSNTDPEKRAIMRAEKTVLQNSTLYILTSPLLFYGITEIISRLPDDSHIICFELSKNLLNLSNNHIPDLLHNSKLITVSNKTEPQDISNTVDKLGIWNFRRVKHINITGGYSLYSSEYKNIINNLDNKIQEYWKNRMTLIHMGPLWIRNIFLNLFKLYHNTETLPLLAYPYIDCPILVTGAGESLEGSIKFIKEKRDNFKILAVDTSVSVLLENGIEPDYIIAVDAQIYNFYDFMKVKNKGIPLFFDLTGYPGILPVMKGSIHPFISNFANTKLLNRLEYYKLLPAKLPALGSVGITAIYLALELTGERVFYTGLDFSYKIGKSHANGSPRSLAELVRANRLVPMEQPEIYYARPLIYNRDKSGDKCITDLILTSYADLMLKTFKQNKRLFDIGKTGLYNGGILTNTADLIFNDEKTEEKHCKTDSSLMSINNFEEFCKNEIILLNRLYDAAYLYLSGRSKKSEIMLKLLKEVDYLYLHFPDKSPEPSIEHGFLKRILISCGYYIKMLERYV